MTKLFFLPGGLICDAVGLTEDSFRSRRARFLERGHFTVQGHARHGKGLLHVRSQPRRQAA